MKYNGVVADNIAEDVVLAKKSQTHNSLKQEASWRKRNDPSASNL